MIHWLTQVTPAPSPSAGGSGQSFFDLKDYVTALAATLTATIFLAGFAVIKQRSKIGTFFKRVGAFFADKWRRLRTPVETIPDLEERLQAVEKEATGHREAREATARELDELKFKFRSFRSTTRTLDDLSEDEFNNWCELNGYKVIRQKKPKLPARWTCRINWSSGSGLFPSDFVLTNRGPGTAHHVMLDAANNVGVPEGEAYWEVIGPSESRKAEIPTRSVRPWGGQPVLKVSWRDEDGEEHNEGLTLSKPPHVVELEDDPTIG